MNRRALLKLFAAAALAGCDRGPGKARGLRVVVAGAGIVGASIAYHLCKAGASVTVIDKKGPATHASRGTFAWINATWAKQPRHYHALNQEGVASWETLRSALDLPVRWGGSIEWFDDVERQRRLVRDVREQADWGEAARMIDAAELGRLEPQVEFGNTRSAAFSANDGAVDPVAATHALLRAAERRGAVVRYPCELSDVLFRAERLVTVRTSLGDIEADKLVLATGAAPDAGRLFAASDIPQRSTPGIVAITVPMPGLLNRVIVAPGVHMHQRADGRIVLGEQGGAPGNDAHAMRLAGRPNDFPTRVIAEQHAGRMLRLAARFLPGIADATVDAVYIGWRPLPADGHPVLGPSPARPDVYLAVMHSGVTLAPIAGQLAAREILDDAIPLLDAFRPGRKFEFVKRY